MDDSFSEGNMQYTDILIKKQASVLREQETVPSSFFSYAQKLRAEKPIALVGECGEGMQSYLLYYIIYIFRLFLGLIAVKSRFN